MARKRQMIRFSESTEARKLRGARGSVQGSLEIKDTHRPEGGPMLLDIGLLKDPRAVRVLYS